MFDRATTVEKHIYLLTDLNEIFPATQFVSLLLALIQSVDDAHDVCTLVQAISPAFFSSYAPRSQKLKIDYKNKTVKANKSIK